MEKQIINQEGMPTVIKLKPNNEQNDLVDALETLLDMAKSGELKNFALVGYNKDNMIVSAKTNVTLLEQQQFASYMQTECTIRTIVECAPVHRS